jgi:quercetin dioxygenase-like cupin family protein
MTDEIWVKELDESVLHPIEGIQGEYHRFIQPTRENGGLIGALGRLLPGQETGYHKHPEPEVFFVLRGEGEARWRQGEVEHVAELFPGVAFYKTGGIPHQMVNTGGEPLLGFVTKISMEMK